MFFFYRLIVVHRSKCCKVGNIKYNQYAVKKRKKYWILVEGITDIQHVAYVIYDCTNAIFSFIKNLSIGPSFKYELTHFILV